MGLLNEYWVPSTKYSFTRGLPTLSVKHCIKCQASERASVWIHWNALWHFKIDPSPNFQVSGGTSPCTMDSMVTLPLPLMLAAQCGYALKQQWILKLNYSVNCAHPLRSTSDYQIISWIKCAYIYILVNTTKFKSWSFSFFTYPQNSRILPTDTDAGIFFLEFCNYLILSLMWERQSNSKKVRPYSTLTGLGQYLISNLFFGLGAAYWI